MRWQEIDWNEESSIPDEPGCYAIVNANDEKEDGLVYVVYAANNDTHSLAEESMSTVGWRPTHYCFLEPVPRYSEDEKILYEE